MIRATQFSTMWATHEIQLRTGHDHLFCARLRVVSCIWFNFKFQLIWGHSANSFFIVIQFQWKFHFPMINLNSIELIAANFCSSHYTRHRRGMHGMCSVMWYNDKSKCQWNVNCDWKIVSETNPWTGYPYRGTALSWKLNWKIPHISAFLSSKN